MNEQKMLVDLIEWHKRRSANCRMVIENNDADLTFPGAGNGDEPLVIPADSELAEGVRLGVSIALSFFTPFPLTIASADDEDCEDE